MDLELASPTFHELIRMFCVRLLSRYVVVVVVASQFVFIYTHTTVPSVVLHRGPADTPSLLTRTHNPISWNPPPKTTNPVLLETSLSLPPGVSTYGVCMVVCVVSQ